MTEKPRISLIVCTRNRGKSLDRMLELLLSAVHDNDQLLEILVMDNGSSDETATTVAEYARRWGKVIYSNQPNKGLSHARNKAVELAKGEILAWTDDDLVVTKDWLSNLVAPIVANDADCVVGRVEIAPNLLRDWMQPFHRLWLAENINPHEIQLIGANMAMRRSCFEDGMAFDPETGPGALGYMDDTLLGMRLRKLGKRIVYNNAALVVHHFSVERVRYDFWIRTARAAGRSTAYVSHHWEHRVINLLLPRLVWQRIKLGVLLTRNRFRAYFSNEGIGEQEFGIRKTISYLEGMHSLKGIPFKY